MDVLTQEPEITGHETLGHGPQVEQHHRHALPQKQLATPAGSPKKHGTVERRRPTVHKHFVQRPKQYPIAQVSYYT